MALQRTRCDHRPELSTRDRPPPIFLPSSSPPTWTQIAIHPGQCSSPRRPRPRVDPEFETPTRERGQASSPTHLLRTALHPRPIDGHSFLARLYYSHHTPRHQHYRQGHRPKHGGPQQQETHPISSPRPRPRPRPPSITTTPFCVGRFPHGPGLRNPNLKQSQRRGTKQNPTP